MSPAPTQPDPGTQPGDASPTAATPAAGTPDVVASPPLLTVVRGVPTPEQLAALIAVVTARADAGGDEPPSDEPSLWAAPVLRTAVIPGPGAWRASGLPR